MKRLSAQGYRTPFVLSGISTLDACSKILDQSTEFLVASLDRLNDHDVRFFGICPEGYELASKSEHGVVPPDTEFVSKSLAPLQLKHGLL